MDMPPVKEAADKQFFNARPCKVAKAPLSSFVFSSDQVLVNLRSDFDKRIENLFNRVDDKYERYGILAKTSRHIFKVKISSILKKLSSFDFKDIILEPTLDGSVLFKFSQSSVNYYVEYFAEHKNEGVDELVLTGIKDGEIVVDFSGPLLDGYQLLQTETNQFIPKSIPINASTLPTYSITENELSYY